MVVRAEGILMMTTMMVHFVPRLLGSDNDMYISTYQTLGNILNENSVAPDPEKVKTASLLLRPETQKEQHTFVS